MPDPRKYSDRREYIIKAVDKRRKKLREKAIEYKGGKCIICGYNKCSQALDFHHLDKSKKKLAYQLKDTQGRGIWSNKR